MKALLAASVVMCLPAATARADISFEVLARAATKVKHVEDIVWAMTAACDKGDDVQQRACRILRERARKKMLAGTLLVDADADAFVVERWNPRTKSTHITLSGCIRCGGVEVEGRTWVVRAASAGLIYDNGQPFTDDAAAAAWALAVANHRVQLLVKAPRRAQVAGRDGITFDVVGFRVIALCDGGAIVANPSSQLVTGGPCADPVGVASPDGVDGLTPGMVETAMKPVVAAAKACRDRDPTSGVTKLALTISGDGRVLAWHQDGDFNDTTIGVCIAVAMGEVTFPRSKKATTKVTFPIDLR